MITSPRSARRRKPRRCGICSRRVRGSITLLCMKRQVWLKIGRARVRGHKAARVKMQPTPSAPRSALSDGVVEAIALAIQWTVGQKVMREFVGKIAFVTGRASGIGLAVGAAFAEVGCKIMLADIEKGSAGCGGGEPLRVWTGNTGRCLRYRRFRLRRQCRQSDLFGLRQSPHPMQQRRGWCSALTTAAPLAGIEMVTAGMVSEANIARRRQLARQ
jgi:hypothetical protein